METTQVPVDVLHWLLAIVPIVVLLVFLVPLRWRAPEAAPMAMFAVALIALLAFETPLTPSRSRVGRACGTPSSSCT